ncbi:CheY chemotaxis protein or a CheY-like REC (receiver) domain [Devosia crocina]|uniref:CheY chemotaxis protein or a CheY-like REC (Receiver) domain n=1 Tax=Devosia crocina TaxID=429728 RepID=A0A1I7N6N8_9HYPH|nr:response regulator [Devosia crocina]SFV30338.1 CheY chemotaxis protein or a CheY-like REC (receiver) domain [Devosia crocina]
MAKFSGSRVFVVEDETLVLFNLEDILAELGCEVVSQAMRLEQALTLAQAANDVDVAILDVNIGGTTVFPVAEILAEKGIPLLFATGYGREGLPVEWQDQAVIVKPYSPSDVERALAPLLEAASQP